MEDEKKLDALTDQPVVISLGGKRYQARRATLYDVGLMNRKRKELEGAGETGNLDFDTTFFILWNLLKDNHPEIKSPDDLAKAIPFEYFQDVTVALEQVGFKVPQPQIPGNQVTGA